MGKLPVSRLVNVDVVLSALAAQAQNLNSLLVLTSEGIIDVVERMRTYTTATDVAADFGTTGHAYQAALAWFSQSPQPDSIKIGRWAKTATNGKLVCGPLSAAEQGMSNWTAITSGGFKISIDGVAAVDVESLTFAAITNLNGVAAAIQAGIRAANAAYTTATVVWNANLMRFEIESGTTGVDSKVVFLTAPTTGADISGLLKGLSTSSGAYVADGIALETAVAAVAEFDDMFGQSWYGLNIPEADNSEHLAVAAFIEATDTKHIYGVTTQEGGALSTVVTDDLASQLKALGYKKTCIQYCSNSLYAICSYMGRILTTKYTGNNTCITLMYKDEPGIVAETLRESQMQALKAKNCNVFVGYNNDTAIIEPGLMCNGDFTDTIAGADAFAVTVMNEVYNLLYTSPTKIPQTNEGNHLLVTTIEAVCSMFVTNGYLAPGVWDQSGFGKIKQGDFLEKGFYVYAPDISTQLKADRQARKSVSIQVAAKCAGAIHTVDITLNISR